MQAYRCVFEGRDYGTVKALNRHDALYKIHWAFDAETGRRWIKAAADTR